MLEWQLVEGRDQCLQIMTTLQSTSSGKKKYQALFERQMHLQELVRRLDFMYKTEIIFFFNNINGDKMDYIIGR